MNTQKARSLLQNSAKILLVGSQNWQVDQMAGLLALEDVLSSSDKEVLAVSAGEISHKLKFLKNTKKIKKSLVGENGVMISLDALDEANVSYEKNDGKLNILVSDASGKISRDFISVENFIGQFDLIVTVGVDQLEDCGEVFSENTAMFSATTVLNISNNPANEMFGNVNLVSASSSSVSEILAELVFDSKFKENLTKNSINAFFAGISAATDNFLSAKTSSMSLALAAKLQSEGADHSQIIEHLFKRKTEENVRVLGRLLNNLNLDKIHRFSWTGVSLSDFELAEAGADDLDSWTDELLCHVNGADFLVSFIEHSNKTVVEIKSEVEDFDFSYLKDHFELTEIPSGVSFKFLRKSIAEVQAVVLQKIADFQEKRLGLLPTEITKVDIYAEKEEKIVENHAKILPKKSAAAPAEVPFIAPMK